MKLINKLWFNIEKNGLIILGIYTLIPLIVISFFNNPCADDYCFALAARDKGFLNSISSWYSIMTGRFMLPVIMYPLSFSCFFYLYKLVPLILLALLIISVFLFQRSYFDGLLSRKEKLSIVSAFMFLLVFQMPNIRHGVYFLNTNIIYLFPFILFVFLLKFLIKICKQQKETILSFIISSFLVIVISGCHEIYSLVIMYALVLFIIFNYYFTKKINFKIIFLLVINIIVAYIVISAPGNYAREAWSINVYPSDPAGRKDILLASVNSVKTIVKYLFEWFSNPLLLIFSIFFIRFIDNIIGKMKSNFLRINPIFSTLILLSFLFIIIFPSYWATNFFVDRIGNAVYYVFLLGYFLNLSIITYYLKNNFGISFNNIPGYIKFVCICIILLSLNFTNQTNNIRYAYVDIVKGTAYRYNRELNSRYEIIKKCKSDTCLLDSLTNKPYSIYYGDISSKKNDWVNNCTGDYFNKVIRLKTVK